VTVSAGERVEDVDALAAFCNERMGDERPVHVVRLPGGGSCEVFAVDRGDDRWVLRRAPRHASSSTAHDVLREFRILSAIADEPVRIARPVASCADPHVFGSPFYLMARIDGEPIRSNVPAGWANAPHTHGDAVLELVDELVAIHAVDWNACGLGDLGHPPGYLERQIARWLAQLDSYGGRALPAAREVADWLAASVPVEQPQALCHGDYKLDNVLFAPDAPRLLAVVDWEMASIGDPLVDLAWSLIFHPGSEGLMPLGVMKEPKLDRATVPPIAAVIDRYATRSGRDVSAIDWYHTFARWKLGIVLEGTYAKWQRGQSDNKVHEHFGPQADRALDDAVARIRS
jgi:aminoglycoside phosphotransferase (APT) family kinase protein